MPAMSMASALAVASLIVCLGFGDERIAGPHGMTGITTTNWTLTPAGVQATAGDRPLGAALSPDGRYLAVSNDGEGVQSLTLLETAAKMPVQSILYHAPEALYVGVVWSPDGRRLFASAGSNNLVRTYELRQAQLTEGTPIVVADPKEPGYPAGLAMAPDGHTLFAAENVANRVVAIDVQSGKAIASAETGSRPYAVALSPDGGKVYVTNWGGRTLTVLRAQGLTPAATVTVGLHPSALAVDPARRRLYVANSDDDSVSVLDMQTDRIIASLSLAPYPRAPEGSVPDGLAVSPDGRWLFIANAGNNDVAVADLSGRVPTVVGLIPTAWYPTSVTVSRDGGSLYVTNSKGLGAGPNPRGPNPTQAPNDSLEQYIGDMIAGTVSFIPVPDAPSLAAMTARVVQNNGFNEARNSLASGRAGLQPRAIPRRVGDPSLIKHVIYIIKENRTYDQVLGDLKEGNGDPSLVLFGPDASPNHHRLAREFVLLDNFYANAEVSADGHNWSTAAMANDYVQKNWPATYSNRGRDYDFEGGQPAAYPRSGFLWDAASRARVSYRIYGEFTEFRQYPSRGTMPSLDGHVSPGYHGYDLKVPDQTRLSEWLAEFQEFERAGTLPQLLILRLPNDHTAGTRPGYPTPQAMVADNDLALGRIVEAVGHSRFWKETLVVATEDDAQDGPDHVDAHRTIALLAGAYVRRGVVDHTFYSTVSLLRTIELILGISPLTQYDLAAQPVLGALSDDAKPLDYTATVPRQSLRAINPPTSPGAAESLLLHFEQADLFPPGVLNRILWRAVKGIVPLPPSPREIR
jgi:YVTN family beta-propeller protein